MWMRWNDTSHIFEQSFNDGASWAVLPLNASVINEGAINIARLPPNVAYNNLNNNFTASQTATGLAVTGSNSLLSLTDTTGAVNARLWRWVQYGNGQLRIESLDDNQTAVQGTPFILTRAGAVTIGAGLTVATGLVVTTGGLTVSAGGAFVVGGMEMTGLLQVGSTAGPSASFPAWRNTGAQMECVTGNNAAYATVGAQSFYSFGAGNNLGDLTVRGATNFQGGINITAGGLTVTGTANISGQITTASNVISTGYVFPGRVDASNTQQASWYLASHGSYGLYVSAGLYVNGSVWAAASLFVNSLSYFGTGAAIGAGWINVKYNSGVYWGIVVQMTPDANGSYFAAYVNNGGTVIGAISAIGSSGVTYSSASDKRLKNDLGRLSDVSGLNDVIVHNFEWKSDKIKDCGVFAQDIHKVFPNVIIEGTDELTDDGLLKQPWMIDYSKFVPYLIAGWQEHEREIAALKQFLRAKNN